MGDQIYSPVMQVFTSDGDPGVGYKLYTYESGTTTPKTVYTDEACTVAAANPVVFDSRGEATIYYADEYKFVLKTDADVTVWTVDSVGTAPTSATTAYEYYPDAGEDDQGVEGGADTLYAFIADLSAATDKATYRFRNPTGTASTTYTLSTSLDISSYKNVKLIFDQGAVLSIDSGVVFNFDGVLEAGPYQIFSGDGTVVGDMKVGSVIPEWWGAVGDGSTDDKTEIDAALTHWLQRTVPGKFQFLPGKNYLVNSAITKTLSTDCYGGIDIDGYGSKITSGLSSGTLLTIDIGTADYLRHIGIRGLFIRGSGSEDGLIKLDGGDTSTDYFYGSAIENVRMENFGGTGLYLYGNFFESRISGVMARAISSNVTGYGIHAYNGGGSGVVSSISISDCVTDYGLNGIYVQSLTGDVKVQNCTALRAYEYGIYLGNNFGNTVLNCHLENNWESAAAIGTGQAGLYVLNSGVISGCYGTTNSKQKYVVRAYASADNTIEIIGGVSGGSTVKYAYLGGAADGLVTIRGNMNYDCPGDVPDATIGRRVTLYKNYVVTPTDGADEDDLLSYTLPANLFGVQGGIRITAFGTKTNANSENKTLKFYFGSTAVTFHAAAADANDWRFVAEITNYRDDTNQIISWVGMNGTTLLQGSDTASEDTTAGDITIKITGECATGTDAISQQALIVEAF